MSEHILQDIHCIYKDG